MAQFCTGTFPEPLAFSYRALRALTPRVGEFDLVHDNQCLGYGILAAGEAHPDDRHAAPPDHQGPPAGDGARAELAQALVGRPVVLVRQDAGAGRVPDASHRRGQRELDPRHPHRHGCRLRPHAAGARSASIPSCSGRCPEVARIPGRLITTASADVALKGLAYLLEAMAKLRTERDVSLTDHRQAARPARAWT